MIVKFLIFFIKQYQRFISPFFPNSCRFYPTCSEYACESLHNHGFTKGIYFSIRRILRCHPFNPGGYDPVPLPNKMRREISH